MSFSAGGGPSAPQMNVTPLIDVLLVLLIIFMLVVIQEKPKGFNAQIPQQPNPADHSACDHSGDGSGLGRVRLQ